MEERDHATTQNQFYPDMCNVNKNITVEAKLISPSIYKQHVQRGHCHLVHSVTAVLSSRAFIHSVILAVGHFRIPYVPGPGFSCV
jgi:hypothetical protein